MFRVEILILRLLDYGGKYGGTKEETYQGFESK